MQMMDKLNQTSVWPAFVFKIDMFWFIKVKLTKTSYNVALINDQFIHDSGLFMVWFRQA
jgi:hypothetical protein